MTYCCTVVLLYMVALTLNCKIIEFLQLYFKIVFLLQCIKNLFQLNISIKNSLNFINCNFKKVAVIRVSSKIYREDIIIVYNYITEILYL